VDNVGLSKLATLLLLLSCRYWRMCYKQGWLCTHLSE